ncbi:hypothetical protein [Bradyrhizobium sp. AZCC 1721]|uniref:hypothetical protein n=1 Tax=Bradyrhizobium sp. AZCC 1721 TaxID=3117016 RepID=UPI002FF0D8E7
MFTERHDCLYALKSNLRRTAHWREMTLGPRFNDPRNSEAAVVCKRLAEQAELTDDDWMALKPHFSWTSQKWADVLREASRMVGFRPSITDFPTYVRCVRGLLAV